VVVGETKTSLPVPSTTAAATLAATTTTDSVRVPDDCNTLEEAVKRVQGDDCLTTIVLGEGEHVVAVYKDEAGNNVNTLVIRSAMFIVGDSGVPKEEIVVVGGIWFKKGIEGNCHLEHLTLRYAKGIGVNGESSFTMEDVLVEQCEGVGVVAIGPGVIGRCTNVEVRQCGWSGVFANDGGSITLIGAKTTVHHNCTNGESDTYGLEVSFSASSTIQLVFPLTKEAVAVDNGGGGNWGVGLMGDINQIKTIAPSNASLLKSPVSLCSVLFSLSSLLLIAVSELFRSFYSGFSMLDYCTVGVGGSR
jgi:hypothetical protein